MVKQAYSRKGNHAIYIAGVTPYTSSVLLFMTKHNMQFVLCYDKGNARLGVDYHFLHLGAKAPRCKNW